MVTYDARPSAFTQLTLMSEWENLFSAMGGKDAVDGPNSFTASFDIPGRNIVISAGNATIRGMLWRADDIVSTPIPAASAQNRIDRLVLRLTRGASTSATVIQPAIITGTPASTPALPPLTQTPTGIWEFPIVHWTSQSNGAFAGPYDDRLRIVNDTWHPWTAPGGWTGGGAYKMNGMTDTVSLAGTFYLPGSGQYNNVVLFTLPYIWRPSGNKAIPCVSFGVSSAFGNYSNSPGLPMVIINSNGQVYIEGFPSGINSSSLSFDGVTYPLDY